MIQGIQDIYYSVFDMKRATSFYTELLGMTVIDASEWWTSLDCGGQRVGLHWSEGVEILRIPRDSHGAHAGGTLTLLVDDCHAEAERLSAAGVTLLGPVADAPWGLIVAFEDSEGNVLKLMQPVRPT